MLALTLAACSDNDTPQNMGTGTMTGNVLIGKNGSYLIITYDGYPDGTPIEMRNGSENEALFDELQTGDKIEINISLVRESCPGSTDVYGLRLIEKGSIQDIPQHIYDSLKELNWVD
jgi:hypothetical protein